jgi:RHS repeat-associated protein
MTLQATARAGEFGDASEICLGNTQEARWYDAEAGVFLSIDPVVGDAGDPQAFNAYAYARGNPVRYVDPIGMCVPGVASWGCLDPQVAQALGVSSGYSNSFTTRSSSFDTCSDGSVLGETSIEILLSGKEGRGIWADRGFLWIFDKAAATAASSTPSIGGFGGGSQSASESSNLGTALDWYRENYPGIIEGRRFIALPDWARRATDAEGFTIFGSFDTVFIDPTRPTDSIVGTIRHETLHLEQSLGEKLEMIQQDREARALSRKQPIDPKTGEARLPFGEIHRRIYREGDRFRRLYREGVGLPTGAGP